MNHAKTQRRKESLKLSLRSAADLLELILKALAEPVALKLLDIRNRIAGRSPR